MGWKFYDSYNYEIISISHMCELELAKRILDTVAKYYSKED